MAVLAGRHAAWTDHGLVSVDADDVGEVAADVEGVAVDLGLAFRSPPSEPGSAPVTFNLDCGEYRVAEFRRVTQGWNFVLFGERFSSDADYRQFAALIREVQDAHGEISVTERSIFDSIASFRFHVLSRAIFRRACRLD